MIYLTGDTHGGVDMEKLGLIKFPEQEQLGENDYLIILGDFGFPFLDDDWNPESDYYGKYNFWMTWFRSKPFKILWVDGNHENFNFWNRQPITEWHGGKAQIHPDAENVIHLMRGEIYEIEGKTFFCFGGALSIDKAFRIPYFSWWEEEEATPEQIAYAKANLQKHGNSVDYILTHTMPEKVISQYFEYIPDKTSEFLNEVLDTTNYQAWFCGHFHKDRYLKEYHMYVLYQYVMRYP